MTDPIRVLVVDDSAVVRGILTELLQEEPDIEVIGTAPNGQLALDRYRQLKPDAITLDVEMPVMDGLTALKAIRESDNKTCIVMFSTLTERGAQATLDALFFGADDYVTKPSSSGGRVQAKERVRDALVPKLRELTRRKRGDRSERISSPARPKATVERPRTVSVSRHGAKPEILAIGSSTGGPVALAEVLRRLPKDFPLPIVITQHMPPDFTRLLAQRLSAVSPFVVREGEPGAALRKGEAWVAPGNFHMEVNKSGDLYVLSLSQEDPVNSCRPAVDVMFRSVVKAYGSRAIGVILTGMGQDGLEGCRLLRKENGQIVAQDEATSVVWGMPGFVARDGIADAVLPLEAIANEIAQRATMAPLVSGAAAVGGRAHAG